LFRGGLFLTGVATLALMAAVTHRRAHAGRVLGIPLLLWIGTRSYGLYLYHWPIYQAIRGTAGRPLSVAQFVGALALTAIVTEVSFRLIEMPIRRGTVKRWWRRLQTTRDPGPRRMIATAGATAVALSVFAGVNLATAELRPNEIEQSLQAGLRSVTPVLDARIVRPAPAVPAPTTTVPPTHSSLATPSTTLAGPATLPGAAVPTTVPDAAAPTTLAVPVTPPTTSSPATTVAPTTTVNPNRVARLAIGDSVMLGAAGELAALGFTVDAKVSRQMVDTVEPLRWLREAGVLGRVVVVHLGTNGPIGDDTLTRFFDQLVDVRRVLVLTVRAPRGWTAANNLRLAGLPARYPNVVLVDWATQSQTCPGDCFAADDIHLNADGRRFYAAEIARALH
jgi:hypothetical protein